MKPYIRINSYNLNCHFQRHVEESDIIEAEESNARWEQFKAKCLAQEAAAS
jgi:hypothetical protein